MIPGVKTEEFFDVLSLTGLLVVRTWLSIAISGVNGRIVKGIVDRNLLEFLKRVRSNIDYCIGSFCHSGKFDKCRIGLLIASTFNTFPEETVESYE